MKIQFPFDWVVKDDGSEPKQFLLVQKGCDLINNLAMVSFDTWVLYTTSNDFSVLEEDKCCGHEDGIRQVERALKKHNMLSNEKHLSDMIVDLEEQIDEIRKFRLVVLDGEFVFHRT